MYCSNCGRQLPEDAEVCSFCGELVAGRKKQKKSAGAVLKWGFGALIALAAVGAVIGFLSPAEVSDTESETEQAVVQASEETASVEELEQQMESLLDELQEEVEDLDRQIEALGVQDGWTELDGNTYYLKDNGKYVGLWEIDGFYYYFGEDGALVTDTTVDIEDSYKIMVDDEGKVTKICFPFVRGNWSEEDFTYDYTGKASIMEFEAPLEGCTSAELYVECEGLHNTKMDGKWGVHFRIDGEWQQQEDLLYSGESSLMAIRFDQPVTIDAITAYPTVRGNASYSVYFELRNVWCDF